MAEEHNKTHKALDTLILPMAEYTHHQLSAFPPETRVCLALALASRLVCEATANAIDSAEARKSARLVEIGANLDSMLDCLCPQEPKRRSGARKASTA